MKTLPRALKLPIFKKWLWPFLKIFFRQTNYQLGTTFYNKTIQIICIQKDPVIYLKNIIIILASIGCNRIEAKACLNALEYSK